MTTQSPKDLTVFYDGTCPICRREIAFYKNRRGAAAIAWVDVGDMTNDQAAPGLSRQQAIARLHVMRSDGSLVSGASAFATVWRTLPAFRLLGRLFENPILSSSLDHAYRLFLKVRPWLLRPLADLLEPPSRRRRA